MADTSTLAATESPVSAQRAASLMKLATYASVSVAVVLVAAKFAAWLATDSASNRESMSVDSRLTESIPCWMPAHR